MNRSQLNYRWICLITSVIAMLFAGILYAWSILKIPFLTEFRWRDSALAFNFTLTMCTFCLGAFAGSHLYKKIGTALTLILASVLAGSGFLLTGFLTGSSIALLYLTYGILAGSGIGIAYNVLISSVSAWFPDKKGLCSGCLMMGFGASTLLLGSLISSLYEPDILGWRKTLMLLGLVLAAVLVVSALIVRRPGENVPLPAPKKSRSSLTEDFEVRLLRLFLGAGRGTFSPHPKRAAAASLKILK